MHTNEVYFSHVHIVWNFSICTYIHSHPYVRTLSKGDGYDGGCVATIFVLLKYAVTNLFLIYVRKMLTYLLWVLPLSISVEISCKISRKDTAWQIEKYIWGCYTWNKLLEIVEENWIFLFLLTLERYRICSRQSSHK